MDYGKIEAIVRLFDKSGIFKLTVADKSLSLALCRGSRARVCEPPREVIPEKGTAQPVDPPDQSTLVQSNSVGFFRHKVGVEDIRSGVVLEKGKPLFSISSMNLDHAQTADEDCVVLEYLVADGVPVEYGQPVVRIISA